MEHTPIARSDRLLPSAVGVERLSAVASALKNFNREQLGSAIEVLIALLDVADGDPDAETGDNSEDDFTLSAGAVDIAKGLPRTDCIDEDAGSYVEWHTRGRRKLSLGDYEIIGRYEDDEDDDPDSGVEDDRHGFDPESDYGGEEAGEPDDTAPEEFSDPAARHIQKRRIQRTRCLPRYRDKYDWRSDKVTGRELVRYELLDDFPVPPRRSILKRKRGMPRRPRA